MQCDRYNFNDRRYRLFGAELAARLIQTSQSKIYALVRAAGEAEAYHRLRAAWCHETELYQVIGTQVLPVPGDFQAGFHAVASVEAGRTLL